MRLWKSSILILLLAAFCYADAGTPLENARVRRLGEQLRCLCGCGSSVTSCNMLHCEFSEPARQKLLVMVNAGMSDKDILDSFVKQYGTQVLEKPPAEGFNVLGYVMPFIGIAAGLAFLWWFMKRFRRPLAAAGPEVDPATLARYQERIEKDLEELD
jgi:cytochrome c-type biogenesis protein CcmH/NrfF